jgi:hypothetical protein
MIVAETVYTQFEKTKGVYKEILYVSDYYRRFSGLGAGWLTLGNDGSITSM